MRPIWAVVMTIAVLPAWWELCALTGGWDAAVLLASGWGLLVLVPPLMAVCLLGRRKLGRRTSTLFVAQAGAFLLVGALWPASAPLLDPGVGLIVGWKVPVAVLLGHPLISSGHAEVLRVITYTLAAVWLLLIPVIGFTAWSVEDKRVVVA